jgi:ATP-dependent exoDNAse (exonuclease V) alpha subunit
VNRSLGKYPKLGGSHQFQPSASLRPEQRQAVSFALDSSDLAVNIPGAAGTGKTAFLRELQKRIRQSGREVLAVAPTRSAVEELQKVGFPNAMTVERLLEDQDAQTHLRGNVLIVDEAGMLSGRQMSEVIRIAEERAARIVLSGDTKQIHSVEASDALRVLEKESRLRSVSLTQVQRQKVTAYRAAIEELRSDPQRAFERLESMGTIREVPHPDRAKQ